MCVHDTIDPYGNTALPIGIPLVVFPSTTIKPVNSNLYSKPRPPKILRCMQQAIQEATASVLPESSEGDDDALQREDAV